MTSPTRTILFADAVDRGSCLRLWSAAAAAEAPKTLTFGVRTGFQYPTLSRDGRTLLTATRDGSVHRILSITLEKAHLSPARLVEVAEAEAVAWPRLSPDGQRLAWLEVPAGHPVRANVSARLRLQKKVGGSFVESEAPREALFADFDWGPDSDEILYRDPEKGLVLAPLVAGVEPNAIDPHARMPLTSPTGRIGAFYQRRELFLVSASGRSTHRLTHAVSALCWDSDDEALLLASAPAYNRTTVQRLALSDGAFSPLFEGHAITFIGATTLAL